LELDEETYKERLEEVEKQREIARAYSASEELLREKNAVAINGLMTEAVKLLEQDSALRKKLQQRYRHLLVDEFQDTNIAQLRLLELIAASPRNIVVVGDNDQAIYRFRGASFGSFKLLLQRFAGWREGQDSTKCVSCCRKTTVRRPIFCVWRHRRFRTTKPARIFRKKFCMQAKQRESGFAFVELASKEDEASWVAREIERSHERDDGGRISQCCTGSMPIRDLLVEELSRRKIPL